mmetsp:Transcript_60384/g.178841  ORF Transcript_60384/g.178841 Transcript_60384/m.178841 type:complete len:246 (-) Transcript_60384:233-970(-)
MSGTGDKLKKLRNGPYKIDNLRHEKQEQSFAEMPQDPHDGKRHSSEITEGVSNEHRGGVPIVPEKAQRHSHEGQHYHRREHVIFRGQRPRPNLDEVVEQHRASDHVRLPGLQPVDARVNVNGVGAEHGQQPHVEQVEQAEVDDRSVGVLVHSHDVAERPPQRGEFSPRHEEFPELDRNDDRGTPLVAAQEGQGRHRGEEQLIPPRPVEDVVGKPEKEHEAYREQGRVAIEQLRWMRIGVTHKAEN